MFENRLNKSNNIVINLILITYIAIVMAFALNYMIKMLFNYFDVHTINIMFAVIFIFGIISAFIDLSILNYFAGVIDKDFNKGVKNE